MESLQSELEPFELETEPLVLELVDPFTIARGTETSRHNVLVKVRHSGVEGIGEAAPSQRYGESAESVEAALARVFPKVRQTRPDAFTIAAALRREFEGRDAAARAGLECAFLDLLGKLAGLPSHLLLGLDAPPALETSFTIAIADPEEMARRAVAASSRPILKVKLDASGLDGLAAVREARPEARLFADVNEAWSLQQTVDHLPRLVELRVEWLEQPMPAAAPETDWGSLAADRDALPGGRAGLSVMLDESLIDLRALERHACHVEGANVKVQRVGGVIAAQKMLERARELGLKTMLGCMIESSLGIAASIELASLANFADLDGPLLIRRDPFEGPVYKEGCVRRGDAPGLGALPRRS